MAVPTTPLMCAPSALGDVMGRAIMSADMVRGLKKMDSRIWADEVYTPGVWYPGKSTGATCLWYGVPGSRIRSKKITGFIPGAIPEFTQISPEGLIVTKGWRQIFKKLLQMVKTINQSHLENKFKVSLDIGPDDIMCPRCRKAGKMVRSNNASGLCDVHENALKASRKALQFKDEARYQMRKHGWQPTRLKGTQS